MKVGGVDQCYILLYLLLQALALEGKPAGLVVEYILKVHLDMVQLALFFISGYAKCLS